MNYEDLLESFYSGIVSKGDWVIDIGAHSGRHTKPLAALVGKTGKVWAFEPNPVARSWLESNIAEEKAEGLVSVFPFAVSNRKERATFIIANERPEESGLVARAFNGETTTSKVDVDVIDLDSKIDNLNNKLAFMKIDVEGAEFDALKGMKQILNSFRPIVAFEFGAASYEAYDVNPSEVYRYFEGLGYSIYNILGEKLDCESFVESSKIQQVWDYIATPSSSISVVEKSFKNAVKV